MSSRVLSKIIDMIYDTLENPGLWTEILQNLAIATKSNTHVLYKIESDGRSKILSSNYSPEAIFAYSSYYHSIDDPLRLLLQQPSGRAAIWHDAMNESDLNRSEIINDFARPMLGIRYPMGVWTTLPYKGRVVLGLHRAQDQGGFGESERALLQTLSPHFARAVALSDRLESARLGGELALATLDTLIDAVVICDSNGRAIFANRAAEDLDRSSNPALKLRANMGFINTSVSAATPDATSALHRAIHDAAGMKLISTMLLPRINLTAVDLIAFIAPLPNRTQSLINVNERWVMLLIHDPKHALLDDRRRMQFENQVRVVYCLTHAEARLARALADGMTQTEFAEARKLSLNTVRVQMRSIMAKMGVSRQSEVVRLLQNLPIMRFTHGRYNISDV